MCRSEGTKGSLLDVSPVGLKGKQSLLAMFFIFARNANTNGRFPSEQHVQDLFSHVDVHGEGSVSWEDVSNYFIEQGMSGVNKTRERGGRCAMVVCYVANYDSVLSWYDLILSATISKYLVGHHDFSVCF